MNVLWLINIPLPEVSALMGQTPIPYGGWLINASKELTNDKNIKLTIIFPSKHSTKIEKYYGEKISYYSFPRITKTHVPDDFTGDYFFEILREEKPDLVHLYGTEFTHTLAMVNTCNRLGIKKVISIQGLVSKVAEHIFSDLPITAVYGFTFRNLILCDNIKWQKRKFKIKGVNEVLALKRTQHVIGRTTWDNASVLQINSNAKYYFLNETLRSEFYKNIWDIDKCQEHSIFLSQSQDSYKGLHYMLDALPIILENYPNTKLFIAGTDITKTNTIKSKLLHTQYGKYIKSKIKKLNLNDSVEFTGPLDEKEMCKQFLNSNVFVCPSSIENSPNSLGEAMIMGVPSVASYVGGIPDMLDHNVEGYLYQKDASYMLAYFICKIFSDKEHTLSMSKNARNRALSRHNKKDNKEKLMQIYSNIIGE